MPVKASTSQSIDPQPPVERKKGAKKDNWRTKKLNPSGNRFRKLVLRSDTTVNLVELAVGHRMDAIITHLHKLSVTNLVIIAKLLGCSVADVIECATGYVLEKTPREKVKKSWFLEESSQSLETLDFSEVLPEAYLQHVRKKIDEIG